MKHLLIERTSDSVTVRLANVMDRSDYSNLRPSQIWRDLSIQLEGLSVQKPLMIEFFLQKLPQNIRAIVAASKASLTEQELISLADRVYDNIVPTSSNVAAVSSSSNSTTDWDKRLSRLEDMEEKLVMSQSSSSQHYKQGQNHY